MSWWNCWMGKKSSTNSERSETQPKGNAKQSETLPVKNASAFEQQVLDAHNKYRRLHGVPPLELNRQLSAFAKEWAEHLAKTKKFQHRSNSKYGENIFWAQGMNLTGESVVKMWYGEIQNYDFRDERFSSNTGHFTQVVWKSSKELGVGEASSGDSIYIVCNYDPPGNVMGQFNKNVLPK